MGPGVTPCSGRGSFWRQQAGYCYSGFSLNGVALADGVLAVYEMDENTGTVIDNATGDAAADGTLSTVTWVAPGKIGASCTSYNGTSSFAAIYPTLLSSRLNGTVSWWMSPGRASNSTLAERMWGQSQANSTGPDFSMYHHSDNFLYMGWWNTGNEDRLTLQATTANYGNASGTWFHYVFTWQDGGTSTLYINNVSVGAPAAGANPPTTVGSMAQNLRLGHSLINAASGYWSGKMDQWVCWNRVLSPTEITYLWNSNTGRPYPWTVAVAPGAKPQWYYRNIHSGLRHEKDTSTHIAVSR